LSHGPSQHRAQAHDPALLHHRLGHDRLFNEIAEIRARVARRTVGW
jgi:hypothetical protein